MTLPTPTQARSLDQALTLYPVQGRAGALTADVGIEFSNAPLATDPAKGAGFGGLLAALAARAAREVLGISTPLLTLTVQYLAAARFEAAQFEPALLRGGRSVSYASVAATQADRPILSALATFGRLIETATVKPLIASSTPFEALDAGPVDPNLAPWFTRYIEHRFDGGHGLFGANPARYPTLRLWMRTKDGRPLDELRLCFLLDGVFPAYFTVMPFPPVISASADLRYDFIEELTPETSPEGWAIFEFTVRDVGGGWALEDGIAFAPSGRPLALARQRRKFMPTRSPRDI